MVASVLEPFEVILLFLCEDYVGFRRSATTFLFGQLAREDYLELRQEASELHEYSNAKLERVTRYLGVLANKTRKLGKRFGYAV